MTDARIVLVRAKQEKNNSKTKIHVSMESKYFPTPTLAQQIHVKRCRSKWIWWRRMTKSDKVNFTIHYNFLSNDIRVFCCLLFMNKWAFDNWCLSNQINWYFIQKNWFGWILYAIRTLLNIIIGLIFRFLQFFSRWLDLIRRERKIGKNK